ncbi:Sec14p-like phosphatidylinositol transfer family protein [Perilla frutescens var. hirtella]|uniref:Sec14p-like phosphatidylinositol transfer family protein n=1 Tax=Perilla frutescens var. hirtella TaxID=608512 RepID=A0AAD4NWT9_PERFH|nr:Sec14p-like phosphatidylinositol transfer family protein [Perilla frutescens var. hirtella]
MEERDIQTHDVEEKKKLELMRATLEKRDPSCKDVDEPTLRRFLRARDLDTEKASAMLVRCLSWRQTFVPKGFISESEVLNEITQNKMFLQGIDKQGRPVSVVFGFLVFALDKLCQRIPDGVGKFTIIGDLHGYGYCNSDLRANLAAITILQEYYPERLGKLFIVHAPYIFMTMWKIIYPFIDKKTRSKVVFVEDKRLQETLLEEIDESQLPEIYGGKLQLVPIQDA